MGATPYYQRNREKVLNKALNKANDYYLKNREKNIKQSKKIS